MPTYYPIFIALLTPLEGIKSASWLSIEAKRAAALFGNIRLISVDY
jgi:hypothetical protein